MTKIHNPHTIPIITFPDLTVNSYREEYMSIESRLESIERRLCIVIPDVALHKKYPALKDAYETYLLIEKMVYDDQK